MADVAIWILSDTTVVEEILSDTEGVVEAAMFTDRHSGRGRGSCTVCLAQYCSSHTSRGRRSGAGRGPQSGRCSAGPPLLCRTGTHGRPDTALPDGDQQEVSAIRDGLFCRDRNALCTRKTNFQDSFTL